MKISLESVIGDPFVYKLDDISMVFRAMYQVSKFIENNLILDNIQLTDDVIDAYCVCSGDESLIKSIPSTAMLRPEIVSLAKENIVSMFIRAIKVFEIQRMPANEKHTTFFEKYNAFSSMKSVLDIPNEAYRRLNSFKNDLPLIEYEIENMLNYTDQVVSINPTDYFQYFLFGFKNAIRNGTKDFHYSEDGFLNILRLIRCAALSLVLDIYSCTNDRISLNENTSSTKKGLIKNKMSTSGYSNAVNIIYEQILNLGYINPITLILCFENLNSIPSIANAHPDLKKPRTINDEETNEFTKSIIVLSRYID